ncbi:hypothetical protein P280DRAFT_548513 [Massarina eburnea CBS 473.64]|uniref:Rhodopsin domain-containing protein n=1 Tax=Massarina eburnea CBS 473.64 TaxID=1395130 RepID=A0A6A6S443_9PLEO|nr:hypothetical protein P280DRAFT_548513 [Massarina eburnea CBS 473.64]
MSSTPNSTYSQAEVLRTEYALFVLTTLFVITRVVIHVSKRRTLEFQDFFIYLAYALYLGLWAQYIVAVPYLFKLSAVSSGEIAPYPDVTKDVAYMSKLIWTAQMCFYICLWSVKMSLLSLYRKLITSLEIIYSRIWWGIVIFAALAYIGCIISSVMSCTSLKAFFNAGSCSSPDELQNQIISLYYSYAVDVVTDLMVMFLPIHLVWGLRMARAEKAGILVLFGGGFVCIAFGTLRVVQVGIQHGKAVSPEPKWLTLWTVIEVSMAIIIGCSPTFATLVRARIKSKKSSGNKQGYLKQGEGVDLETIGSSGRRNRSDTESNMDSLREDERPVALRRNTLFNGGITVTTTVQQDNRRKNSKSGG